MTWKTNPDRFTIEMVKVLDGWAIDKNGKLYTWDPTKTDEYVNLLIYKTAKLLKYNLVMCVTPSLRSLPPFL